MRALALVIGVLLGLGAIAALTMVGHTMQNEWYEDSSSGDSGNVDIPLCIHEDQAYGPCYWDGGSNGEGKPFYLDANGNVTYQEEA
jgi:hypothetical protein